MLLLDDFELLLKNNSKTYIIPQFHAQNVILLNFATKNVMFHRGWVTQFVANGKRHSVYY